MNEIWKSSTYQVVKAMKARGNRPGLIAEWKAGVEAWAMAQPPTRDVLALRAWLPLWQARAAYTAAELCPMMPALAAFLGHKDLCPPRSPKRMAHRLRYMGLPVLWNEDGQDTFVHPATGRYERFFIVEHIHRWRNVFLTQREFEQEFFNDAGKA